MKKRAASLLGIVLAAQAAWGEPKSNQPAAPPSVPLASLGAPEVIVRVQATAPAPAPTPATAPTPVPTPAPATHVPVVAFAESCGGAPRVWASTEYLLWWMRGGNTPPLIVTGRPATDPLDNTPTIGQATTQVLFGGSGALDYGVFSGLRGTIGFGLDDGWGVEVSGFFTEQRSVKFGVASDGSVPLAIPYVNNDPNGLLPAPFNARLILANPTAGFHLAGDASVASQSRLWGAEFDAVRSIAGDGTWSGRLIGGFRYAGLDENLALSGGLNDLDGDVQLRFREAAAAHNQFYGGQIGGALTWTRGIWSADLLGKIALGVNHEVVSIAGNSSFTGTGIPNATFPSGVVFALPSNIGRRSQDEFAAIPQIGVKLGCQLTDSVRAFVGYDFLYWSDVVRAGDQFNPNINGSQRFGAPLVGPALPPPAIYQTSFWAQGINFGLEFRY